MPRDSWLEKSGDDGASIEERLARAAEAVTDIATKFAAYLEKRVARASPSDLPSPPSERAGEDEYDEAVRREEDRLRKHFNGPASALRRAAILSVKTRRRGSLDGVPFHERPMDSKRGKAPRIL